MGRKLRFKLSRVVWPHLWLLKLVGRSGSSSETKAAWYCRFAIARAAACLYNYRKNTFLMRIARTRRQGEAVSFPPARGSILSSPRKSNSLRNIATKYCNNSKIMNGGPTDRRRTALVRKDGERMLDTRELERKLRILAGGERYSPSLISYVPLIRSPKTRIISAGLPSPVHILDSAASKEGALLDCDTISFNCKQGFSCGAAASYNYQYCPVSRTLKYSLHQKSSSLHRFSTFSSKHYGLASPSPSTPSSPSSPSSSSLLESVLVRNYSDIRDMASSSSSSFSFTSDSSVFRSAIFDENDRRRQLALEDKLSTANRRRLGFLKGNCTEDEKAIKLRQITTDEACNNNDNIYGGGSGKSFASCENMAKEDKLSTPHRRKLGSDEMNMERKTRLRKITTNDGFNNYNSNNGHGTRRKSFTSYANIGMDYKLSMVDRTSDRPLLHCNWKKSSERCQELRAKMQQPDHEDQYAGSAFDDPVCNARIKKANIKSAKSRTFDRFAMAKLSYDPLSDFKQSMAEMMREKELFLSHHDLQDLLKCYLSLNSRQYHGIIIDAFRSVLSELMLSVHAT